MKKIEWTNRLSVGIKKIDDQHKRLIKLVNNLVSAMQSDMADDIIAPICQELAEYADYHFRDEEMYMQEVGYPKLEEQKEQHQVLSDKVQSYLDSFDKGKTVNPKEVLDFLKLWLIDHMIHSDMQIGKFTMAQHD